MQQFLMAAAHGGSATRLAGECIAQLGPVPSEATLGFVYASDALAGELDAVLQRLGAAAPGVDWVGTLGIALCATGSEYYDEPALALLITDLPRKHFRILPPVSASGSPPEEIGTWCDGRAALFGLLHGDPADPGMPSALAALNDRWPALFANGGLTSSDSENLQVAGCLSGGGGLSGVIFDEAVSIVTDHTQGCSPIGPEHRITDAERNVVRQLDGRRALEVMKGDIGEVLARDLTRIGGYIFVALPVPGSDIGDYLVRNLLALDTHKGAIAVGEYLEAHDRLLFCRRDANSALEDLMRMLARLHRRVGGRTIRGGVYVSCLGRGRYQFGAEDRELQAIREMLGDFPLVGFFASGEIYHGRLYGYTGVLTLFLGEEGV